jgi:hypothetical protein
MRFSRDVVSFSYVVRASDFQCQSRSSPDPIFKLLRSPRIQSKVRQPYSYSVLTPIDCLKIPALGSIPACSDTVKSEGQQIKMCLISTYMKKHLKNLKNPPVEIKKEKHSRQFATFAYGKCNHLLILL